MHARHPIEQLVMLDLDWSGRGGGRKARLPPDPSVVAHTFTSCISTWVTLRDSDAACAYVIDAPTGGVVPSTCNRRKIK
jgi:hypothetical protein